MIVPARLANFRFPDGSDARPLFSLRRRVRLGVSSLIALLLFGLRRLR